MFPWLDKVQSAIDRVRVPQRLRIHSGAGDLGINETALRQALHARGMLTVGIPKSVEPMPPPPTPEEIGAILPEAGFRRQRPPHQVQLACAPVAIVVQWGKATSPVYSRAAPAQCVTKACRALSSNKG